MAQQINADPTYIMGRTDAEAERLMLQSRLLDRITHRFLADAGITPGMTVLDVGSGAGDVTFAAADLVGPQGRVIGIDLNPVILETAQARAAAEARNNVTFVAGDCRDVAVPKVDAAVGRLVLFYTSNFSETLQTVAACVKPGGIVAFAELDLKTALDYMRAGPEGIDRTLWEWMVRGFAAAGISTAMVVPLSRAFVAAGLGSPELAMHARFLPTNDADGFAWLAATLRSMLPLLEKEGIVTAEMLDVESVAAPLPAEVVATGYPFIVLPMVTAWARKP